MVDSGLRRASVGSTTTDAEADGMVGLEERREDGATMLSGCVDLVREMKELLAAQTRLMTNTWVTDYDGTRYGSEAREWITKLRNGGRFHHWPESMMMETGKMHLTGAVKAWYEARMHELLQWGLTDLWEKMRQRKQGMSENTSVYFHEKYKLCRQLRLTFDEAKEQLVSGLNSTDIKGAVLMARHNDVDGEPKCFNCNL
ncbi:hypothetical protein FQR65_LT11815 [Abscondita terminalis]|nr:hypothetical protein FQR65_LT11815 [Abscondita terminalis]